MPQTLRTLDDHVEAFERARQVHPDTDLRAFLPPNQDPLYATVLRELIRIDLEFGWEAGSPRSLDDYQSAFPELFSDPESLQEIAFEEYRLRRQAGQNPSPQEYASRYGLDASGWPVPVPKREGELGSIQIEDQVERVARSFHAFQVEASITGSIRLDDWRPPSNAGPEVVRLFRDLHAADLHIDGVQAARALALGIDKLPQAGETFHDFRLLAELGRGAFGRVFLARQALLADRPVALKVAADVAGESAALAQLQHTHIVPIYSVHRQGPLYAVCMPFNGSSTLADVIADLEGTLAYGAAFPQAGLDLLKVLTGRSRAETTLYPVLLAPSVRKRLATLTYPEAVLWLGGRLADALAHAHERGILHRDVKPANILLTDEGIPMLLDFNVAEDVKQRGASAAMLGGTLPYMAPEHLSAFRVPRAAKEVRGPAANASAKEGAAVALPAALAAIDARADLYSLGIVLFQLLTSQFPFSPVRLPVGPGDNLAAVDELLGRMLGERQAAPPCPREINPQVSPAAAAIVRKLLSPDPAQRYQSARDLQEDVDRHLDNLPLRHAPNPSLRERTRKWFRRHPSSGLYASLLGISILFGLVSALAWHTHKAALEADNRRQVLAFQAEDREATAAFESDFPQAQFVLGVRPDSTEKRQEAERLAQQALQRHEALIRIRLQGGIGGVEEGSPLLEDKGELLLALASTVAGGTDGRPTEHELREALRLNNLAAACFAAEALPPVLLSQRADLLAQLGDVSGAATARLAAERRPPESARDLYLSARDLCVKGRFREARTLLEKSVRLNPTSYWAWFLLGITAEELGDRPRAITAYTVCVSLGPQRDGAFVNRGLVYLRLRDFPAARDDFDQAVKFNPGRPENYFLRALAREGAGDLKGAQADLNEAVDRGLPATRIYFHRARLRQRTGDLEGAKKDRAEGLARTPTDELSWIARGLARLTTDAKGAVADFDKALQINPASRAALMNKAHALSDHLDDNVQARKVMDRVLALYPDHPPALAGQAVLLARLGERDAALKRAKEATERDLAPVIRYQAACAYSLTSRQVPADANEAVKLLRLAVDGRYGLDLLASDPDLAPLRERADFQKLQQAATLLRR